MSATVLTDLETLATRLQAKVAACEAPCESGELYALLAGSLSAAGDPEGDARRGALSGRIRIHRRAPYGLPPGAARAAEIVADLVSVAADGDGSRLNALVYFTDDGMAGYLRGRGDGLGRLYDLDAGAKVRLDGAYLGDSLRGFEQGLAAKPRTVEVTALLARDYAAGFGLRVWLVVDGGGTRRRAEESRTRAPGD